MSNLASLQAELAQYEDDLKTANEYLALFPDDEDAQGTPAMLEEQIALTKAQIAEEKAKADAAPPPPPSDDAPPPPPKFDMSKHPKFQKPSPDDAPPPPDEAHQQLFNTKDVVMAKFSEDKQWYPATVNDRTGSTTDPQYKVTFKGYGNTETKRKHEIRPMRDDSNNPKKRKADGSPATSTTPQQQQPPASPNLKMSSNGHVISAAPSVDTSLVQQKREPSKVSDGPTRMAPEPKKLKGQKQLQKNQSNWQSWASSGPKKVGFAGGAGGAPGASSKKKESMFRTPDLPGAKVGFTGSGKPMQKDQARAKWNYGGGGPVEGEE